MEPPRDAPLVRRVDQALLGRRVRREARAAGADDLDGDAPPPDDEGLGAILGELARDEEAAFKARDEL